MGMEYGSRMDRDRVVGLLGVCGWLLASAAQADVSLPTNSNFRVIVDRNPFGLKPPPTNQIGPPEVAKPPPVPVLVKLAGITSDSAGKRAWLVFPPAPGKPNVASTNTAPLHYALREGDAQGDIKVLEINPRDSVVKILNAGNAVTLDFTNHAPAAVAVPASLPGGIPGAPGLPRVMPAPAGAAPNANPGMHIPVPGQPRTAMVNPAAPAAVQPASFGGGSGNPAFAAGAVTDGSAGLRTIPSRPTRVMPQEAQLPPQVDPAVQAALMREQQDRARAAGNYDLPPIPQ
jgi:hypothetical protein